MNGVIASYGEDKEIHVILDSKRLTNRTYHFAAELGKPRTDYIADEVGGVADIFPLAQAPGVNFAL
jgi:hypothetical protein